MFEGVFGASDEILGVVDSGLDFEKKISKILQNCRTEEQIQQEFDALQQSMEETIQNTQSQAREDLLNNFDQEVIEKVKIDSERFLSKFEERLWSLTRFALNDFAEFNQNERTFNLTKIPYDMAINFGIYRMAKRVEDANNYRIGHPLAQKMLETIKHQQLSPAHVTFNLTNSGKKIAILEPLLGKSGWLQCSLQSIHSIEDEEHVLLTGVLDDNQTIDTEQCSRLFDLPGNAEKFIVAINDNVRESLDQSAGKSSEILLEGLQTRNSSWFDSEIDKIEKWAEDKNTSLKRDVAKFDQEIKEISRQIRQTGNMADKLQLQRHKRELDKKRDESEQVYRDAKRKSDQDIEKIMDNTEKQLSQRKEIKTIFTMRFSVQ